MSQLDELRRENEQLRRQLADARQTLDAVQSAEASIPVLLRAAQEKLRENESLLRSVFEGALDALLLMDGEGAFVEANAATCELIGLPREQLLGRGIDEFARPGIDAAGVFRAFPEPRRGQFTLQRPDGATRIIDYSAVPNVAAGLHFASWRDATDRVAAENALRRSEARFRAMIEKSQGGITLLDADAHKLYQSPAVEGMHGYTLENSKHMDWREYVDEDQRPQIEKGLAVLMKGLGASTSFEVRIRRRDGTQRWLEVAATNWLDDPDIGGIVINFRDITERRALEQELQGFFALSLDMLCIAGIDGRFRRLNPAWQTTLGWSLDELYARPWLDFVHPDDREATAREGATLALGHVAVRFENRYRCKDGSYRRLTWNATPASDTFIYSCARDVTEERAAAERDRLLFAASPLPMWLVDPQTMRFMDANDAVFRAFGYTREEFLSLSLLDIVIPEQHDELPADLATLEKTGRYVELNRKYRTKSGDVRDVQVTGHKLDVEGRSALLKVIVDVTDGKRLEKERAEHAERLRLLEAGVSHLNDIVMITKAAPLSAPGPEIVYVNDAFARVTGYSREEAIGRNPRILQGPETDRAAVAALRVALERAEPHRTELLNYTKAGTPYWIEIDVTPVADSTGVVTHFVAVERDVTEQRRIAEALRQSEERFRQAQKMEAIGTLAGGVAHDFNNMLSVILSYTSLMLTDLPQADPLRQDLMEIHRAGLRATELTRQLLAFSRKQILQPTVIDINVLVENVRKMLGRVLGEDIELLVIARPNAGKILADAGQLEQVLMNLVVNARDAMPDGGSLTIETSSLVLDDAYAEAHPGARPGPHTLLAVTDTGIGMDRATRERVFDPFFTTKEQGKGTGLGLSTVYGIVKQSGGHIWLYSEPGQGTSFKIYLPRTDRIEEPASSEPEPAHSLHGTETILLVEDEDPVRDIVRTILQRNGYHVLEAQNGGEAFLLCEQFKATVHLLITDVVMPRMSGKQLAERLAVLRPAMRVLFVSGYTENTIVHHGVLDAGVEFLPKPILPDALLKKVRRLLDTAAPAPSS